ncbi:MAG TPA: hypothetical protein PLO51_05905 [Candidatus Micrarchaeota archaeon]|nr:hypothetical protein [Candidatus Micrarchaeota archaeon]
MLKSAQKIALAVTPIRASLARAPKEFLARNGLKDEPYRAASEGAHQIIRSSSELAPLWK